MKLKSREMDAEAASRLDELLRKSGHTVTIRPRHENIKDQVARVLGVNPEDFSEDAFEILITIGMGMFWSERLNNLVRAVAEIIREDM